MTFTATVMVNSPGSQAVANPTGTVTFYDGGVAIGTGTLSNTATDTATFATSALPTGTDAITAAYTSGDGNFNASAGSNTVNQVVNKANTATAVISSVNPSLPGQAVTFTATVTVISPGSQTAANPTGTVTFYDGGVAIGMGTLSNTVTDTATFTTSALVPGANAITAAYTIGDSNFNASPMSSAITQLVAGVFVMNPTSSGAATVSGNGNFTIPGALEIKSNATTALVASGNAVVKAPSIGIVGGDTISGKASVSTPLNTGVAASSIVDPFAGLAVPVLTGSLQSAVNVSGSSSLTINPGIYSGITVSGSGKLTMNPGIYVIAGGGFTVSGSGSVAGSGVMIYNAGNNYVTPGGTTFGPVNLSSTGTINLSGPSTGAYNGIAIFQSRDNTKGVTVSGPCAAGITGAIYALGAPVTFSGNAQFGGGLVANTLLVSGNSVFNTETGANGFTPAQIRDAYGVNNLTLDGTGQTIAIVDAYDNPAIFQSVDTLDEELGLTSSGATLYQEYGPASSFLTVLNQSGQPGPLPATDPTGAGVANWELESSLDVEWIHAIAPGARIVLVEANSQSLSDLMQSVATAASQPGVSVVSMSWGFTEGQSILAADEAMYDPYLTTPAGHQGVTFVASTGDYGAADPIYPAFSPNVLAVGGTALALNADHSYNSETGWGYDSSSMGEFIGSGGGLSQYEVEPAYQRGAQSTGYRTTPDVSFVADPATGAWIADLYNLALSNPWEVVGGTSLSAPTWAGVIALVNEGRAAAGQPTLNSSSPTETQQDLYNLSQNDYHVITSGSNGYSAGAGYNLVTGLGSPIVNLLVPDLIIGNFPATGQVAPISAEDLVYSGSTGGNSGGANVMNVFTALTMTAPWTVDLARTADRFAPAPTASGSNAVPGGAIFAPAAGPASALAGARTAASPLPQVWLLQAVAADVSLTSPATNGSVKSSTSLMVNTLALSSATLTLPTTSVRITAEDSGAPLYGGLSTDVVIGGKRRKLTIGGMREKREHEGRRSGALAGGQLPHDADQAALEQALSEWSTGDDDLLATDGTGTQADKSVIGFLIAAAICDAAIADIMTGRAGRSRLLRRARPKLSEKPADRT